MEVVCGRCKADYEFDDALISARGTVVRCTNCGLQFKVFPTGGEGPPEEWSVLNEEGGVLATYATLPDLQRAIGLGEINGDDLLVRGNERPRPLSEILELAPLLRQGASYRPPPAVEHSANVPVARNFDKTTIGLPRFDPRGALTPERSGPLAAVPVAAPPVADAMRPRRGEGPPKIRSALSGPFLGVKVAPDPGPGTLPSGSPPHPSSRVHLPSLSTTLASPVPPSPLPRDPTAHDPQTQRRLPTSRDAPPSEPPFRAAVRASQDPLLGTQRSASPGPRSEPPPPSPRIGAPTPPPDSRVADSRAADSRSLQSSARGPEAPRRMARGALFVIAIGAGAVLFAATLGREQLGRLQAERSPAGPTPLSEPRGEKLPAQSNLASAGELGAEVDALDVEWWRARLNGEREAPRQVAEHVNDLLGRVDAATAANEGESRSQLVALRANLLRMAGRISDARHVIAELGASASKFPYVLATLDLAEAGLGPDLAEQARLSMSARVRSGLAQSGESAGPRPGRSPFLGETAVIYALVSDGKFDQARIELGQLREVAKGQSWPLEGELERLVASAEAKAQERASEAGQVPDAPVDKTEPAPARAGAQKQAPDQMRAWATEADALWSAGDQKAAVVLYQKVKRGLGTKHFLGQRAAARIQQANLEGASR